MRPAAAFGKPFTYLAAAPPSTCSTSIADHRPSSAAQQQTPVPASVLHTFAATGGGSGGAPTPPVRTSVTSTTGKQKPPPVPPRGEQTRLTTVPAKKPEPAVQISAPSPPPPPPPPPPRTTSPTRSSIAVPAENASSPLPPPPPPASLPTPSSELLQNEEFSASALISKFENGCAVKQAGATVTAVVVATDPRMIAAEVDSGTSTLAESTDDDVDEEDDENHVAADIWVRTIESPVKNVHPQKVRHHSDSAIKVAMAKSSLSSPLTEKRGSLPADATVASAADKKSSPPLSSKDSAARSSFRSASGSRCSSPAMLAINNKSLSADSGRKISAAEALGVVAKPCPRILPSSVSLDAACRRQSMGNLTAESRFGTLQHASSIRSSWAPPSGVQTDVESTQSEPSFDYRRKKFTKRCSSADGRNPVHHHHHHHHYHTLSSTRGTAARDPDFGAKRAFIQEKLQAASTKLQNSGIVPSGLPPTPPPPSSSIAYQQQNGGSECGRPPRSSSCNCGQHQATSRPMFINKRTASAEELLPPPASVTVAEADRFTAAGRPVSASSSSSGGRGSFGRSQRVTFALDQHQPVFAAARPMMGGVEPVSAFSPSPSTAVTAKKPFKSNLKVKDTGGGAATTVPELNVLGTSAINTRLPPQHPHPYGLPYKLPAVTADVLQGKGNSAVMKTLHKPKVSHDYYVKS